MTLKKHHKILITGATGFVGQHLVKEGIRRGFDIYAGVRSSSNLDGLKKAQVKSFPIDLYNPNALYSDLKKFTEKEGGFSYVIHSAAVTKPKKIDEFATGNADFTKEFAVQLQRTQPDFKKFVFISSMAAHGPGDPQTLDPIKETDEPSPNVPYGKSKRQAEINLSNISDFDYLIFRPTAVYGPQDVKFIGRLINIIEKGFDISLGSKNQRSSFVFVEDVVDVIYDGLESSIYNELFNISDGQYYNQALLNKYLTEALDKKTTSIRIPKEVMLAISYVSMFTNSILGKPTHLSPFKVKELTALNWNIDISKAREMLGFEPQFNLEEGIKKSISQWK